MLCACYSCGCMQYKSPGEKMEDTKTQVVNVFKTLEKVKAEPSEGSTFLKDRLVELRVCVTFDQSFLIFLLLVFIVLYFRLQRETCNNLVGLMQELDIAEYFISFYEKMLPFVQTLPLVISQKEIIFSTLVSELHMKARFSLDAFLRFANLPTLISFFNPVTCKHDKHEHRTYPFCLSV